MKKKPLSKDFSERCRASLDSSSKRARCELHKNLFLKSATSTKKKILNWLHFEHIVIFLAGNNTL